MHCGCNAGVRRHTLLFFCSEAVLLAHGLHVQAICALPWQPLFACLPTWPTDLPAGDRHRPRDMALCRILAALHEAAVSSVG